MKKRVVAGILSAALMAGMGFPVYANDTQTSDLTVQTTVASNYTLSIPKTTVDIPYGTVTTNLEVKVAGNVAVDKTVTVSAQNGSLSNGNEKLDYTINASALVWNGTDITAEGTTKNAVLTIADTAWQNAKAGTYKDTITFTATMQ